VFVVVPELLRAIRKGFNQPNDDSDKLVKLTEEAQLLVLDDLGAEKPSDWVREQLYVIINRRYENMLPTIITTNCTTKELIDKIGQRTVSRIVEMTTPYKITAEDYRLRM
jgi:DNA replication protein DnaC